nr:rac GTPase-activating protein 1-like [Danaus plexippus plexippus]
MSTENSDSGGGIALSLVAQFDDINRLNSVLNDGTSEECFLAFVKQMEWVRTQWATAEAEARRLQTELDEALNKLEKWEAKFAHVRKLLDGEKRERNVVMKKYNELSKLLDMARDLLFNDNRAKLNNETLQKLAFLNGTAQQDHNAKLNGVPELNSTGTLLSEMSYSRSEDDLDLSLASTRRSWVQRGGWAARPDAPKKRRSSTSSATKTVELHGGKVLATATTTLTLERAPTTHDLKPPQNFTVELHGGKVLATATTTLTLERAPTTHDLKPPQNFLPISESSDEAQTPRPPAPRLSRNKQDVVPSAPPESESASDTPKARPQRTPSVMSAVYGSPRVRPRQHNFIGKNFYKRETCGPCGKTIKFAKMGVKCEQCRAQAHPECRSLLPLPCVPPGRALAHQEGSIADFAPSTPPMVPALLVHCINEVEKRGLTERGIYRICAVDKDVKRLKERFLRGCGSPSLSGEDVHVVCGCIKDFLRSLKEPLVSSALWADFMNADLIVLFHIDYHYLLITPRTNTCARTLPHVPKLEGSIADFAPSTPPMVPALLVHCINEVEKRGLTERGIYRICAVDKDVKRLKERFLRGCGSPSLSGEDVHVVCGCIKDFLRSLKEPLVSSALWADFMNAASLAEPSDVTAQMVHAVSQLPQPNRDTLAFLVLHLQKVSESPDCEMGVDNLARMFAPSVVGYGLTTAAQMYTATEKMFTVMQVLLNLPGDYWSQWACPSDVSSPLNTNRPRGFFFSPADTG